MKQTLSSLSGCASLEAGLGRLHDNWRLRSSGGLNGLVAGAIGGVLMLSLMGGCSSQSSGVCAAPQAEMPATAVAGEPLDLLINNLLKTCNDTGGGANVPMDTVTVEIIVSDHPDDVIAETTAPVNQDATAMVQLTIPADAQGSLVVRISPDNTVLGTVTVTG